MSAPCVGVVAIREHRSQQLAKARAALSRTSRPVARAITRERDVSAPCVGVVAIPLGRHTRQNALPSGMTRNRSSPASHSGQAPCHSRPSRFRSSAASHSARVGNGSRAGSGAIIRFPGPPVAPVRPRSAARSARTGCHLRAGGVRYGPPDYVPVSRPASALRESIQSLIADCAHPTARRPIRTGRGKRPVAIC